MNDSADASSSRRSGSTRRLLFPLAILAMAVWLGPAHIGAVGLASIGEAAAPPHVEAVEAVEGRQCRDERRRQTAVQRTWLRWRLLLTDYVTRMPGLWRWRQTIGLPRDPFLMTALTRAPPPVH